MMNIIWLAKLTDKDSFRNTQVSMSESLRKQGNEVTLILAKHFTEKKENQNGIHYLPTIDFKILSGLVYGIFIFLLPLLVKNKEVDIFIVSGDTIWSPFLLLFKIFQIPLILDIRSLEIDTEKFVLKDISFYLSRYLTDGLTTITPELADILKKKYHLQDKKIGVWSSGFSTAQFNTIQENITTNHSGDKFVLLYHGTYSRTRGIEELIRSITYIDPPLKKKIQLILIGIPQNKIEDLTKLCKELNIYEQVKIIPPVDIKKIPFYIQSCDVGIIPLPPNNEWWRVSVPLKTLEYLAMGKPIIATNIPFHQKIFDMATCGILINTNTPKEIANAIMSLYQNKEKLNEMGKKGKEIVEKYYTWEQKAFELEEFLKTILASR
jgi:glycosyltransferase involved in cell wall biosynthesis